MVEINFDVARDGMAWREIFGFDLGAAAGAIKFHDADPERVGGETERAGDYWWMDFARVAIVDEAAFFIIFAGGAEDRGCSDCRAIFRWSMSTSRYSVMRIRLFRLAFLPFN